MAAAAAPGLLLGVAMLPLWAGFPHLFGVSSLHFMYAVGVVEMSAGVLVLLLSPLRPTWSPAGWAGSSPTW
jgi:hypothetical protein